MTALDGSQPTRRAKARACAIIDKLSQLFGRTFEVCLWCSVRTCVVIKGKHPSIMGSSA